MKSGLEEFEVGTAPSPFGVIATKVVCAYVQRLIPPGVIHQLGQVKSKPPPFSFSLGTVYHH
jgi:hypothetical protein